MIKSCLIASAGFGTRMGDLGKLIPKPLWPLFDQELLNYQVSYVRELGCENIFVNSHHRHEEMKVWAEDKNVTLVHEKEILGSGGCVHNIKKIVGEDQLLIINSDQFYFFDFNDLKKDLETVLREDFTACLYAIKVSKSSSYNETILENDLLVDIKPATGNVDYYTYSGVGFINLAKIPTHEGPSSFFKTVCNYKEERIMMREPNNPVFLDMGTLDKYLDTIKNLSDMPEVIKNFIIRSSNDDISLDDFTNTSRLKWNGVEFDFDKKEMIFRNKSYSF